MSQAVKRRPGGRSARVKDAVLAATCEVLAEDGYHGLSFEAVADRAGVHKTTVYRRWLTKGDLILEALLQRSDIVIEFPETGRFRADLVAFLKTIAANVSSPLGRALLIATLRTGNEVDEIGSVRHRFWEERFDKARVRLDKAVRDGDLPKGTKTALLIESLVSPIFFRTLVSGEPVDEGFVLSLVRLHTG